MMNLREGQIKKSLTKVLYSLADALALGTLGYLTSSLIFLSLVGGAFSMIIAALLFAFGIWFFSLFLFPDLFKRNNSNENQLLSSTTKVQLIDSIFLISGLLDKYSSQNKHLNVFLVRLVFTLLQFFSASIVVVLYVCEFNQIDIEILSSFQSILFVCVWILSITFSVNLANVCGFFFTKIEKRYFNNANQLNNRRTFFTSLIYETVLTQFTIVNRILWFVATILMSFFVAVDYIRGWPDHICSSEECNNYPREQLSWIPFVIGLIKGFIFRFKIMKDI
ncbi:hypothetical protein M0812_07725 [Anaeramoeba flamelloides]|uniref:Uncharacterized protein n=1 Tax=Anaeramoeba flamelloides TaxID=1746091 RepID=A0AAV8A3C2_9EUKA|nr:hypothetical protein M0812_07725 [Anaeramoeba flamelloides]